MTQRMNQSKPHYRKYRLSRQRFGEETSSITDAREIIKSKYAGTDPNKVHQQILSDVARGEGAMTAREAGSMRKKH